MSSEKPLRITPETPTVLTLGALAAALSAVWLASAQWNSVRASSAIVERHTTEIGDLRATVGALHETVEVMKSKQDTQLEILRYLAHDRRGPVPDSVNAK